VSKPHLNLEDEMNEVIARAIICSHCKKVLFVETEEHRLKVLEAENQGLRETIEELEKELGR
jgi:DNA-binding LytR/AlgR family response regulator